MIFLNIKRRWLLLLTKEELERSGGVDPRFPQMEQIGLIEPTTPQTEDQYWGKVGSFGAAGSFGNDGNDGSAGRAGSGGRTTLVP